MHRSCLLRSLETSPSNVDGLSEAAKANLSVYDSACALQLTLHDLIVCNDASGCDVLIRGGSVDINRSFRFSRSAISLGRRLVCRDIEALPLHVACIYRRAAVIEVGWSRCKCLTYFPSPTIFVGHVPEKGRLARFPFHAGYLYVSSSSSSSPSSLGSRCVPWLGEGLSMPSPDYPVLCCPLPHRFAPVFVQVVSPPLGWSPLSSFLVTWSPSGDTRGPSVVFEAVDMPCSGPFHFSHSVDYIY